MLRLIRIFSIAGLLLAVGTFSARAQQSTDGSVYTRYGLGMIQSSLSSQAEAMGGAGVALISPNYVSINNPASWSSQILTRFVGGYQYHSVQSVDADDTSSRLNSGSIGGAAFSFPLLRQSLGVVAAYTPVTRIGYQVRHQGTLSTDTLSSDVSDPGFETVFEGSGGLQSLRGGVGYRISPYIRVGTSVDFIFGILENGRQTLFNSDQFVDTQHTQSTQLRGVTATVGGIFLIPTILSNDDYLSIGVAARLPTTLNGTRVTTLGETTARDTVGVTQKGNVDLPPRIQAGLAYQASDYVSFSLDGLYAPWKQFSSDLAFPGYSSDGTSTFTDRWQLAAGFEYRPAGRDPNASYLQRIIYRFGGSAEQSYVKPRPEVHLMQYAVTGGLSLPTAVGGNRIDLNLKLGQRGTTNHNLIKDTYYTASVVINFGERWFMKRPVQ